MLTEESQEAKDNFCMETQRKFGDHENLAGTRGMEESSGRNG